MGSERSNMREAQVTINDTSVSIVVSNLILIGLMTYVYFKGDDDDFAH